MPKRHVFLLPLAFSIHWTTTPSAFAAAPPPETEATPPLEKSVWEQLARTVARPDEMAQASDQMLRSVVDALAADDDLAELEVSYPGLMKAFSDALRPLIREEAARIAPLYMNELAELYSSSLGEDEASKVLDFLRSPVMERFRKTLVQNYDMRTSARDLAKSADISSASITSDLRTAGIKSALQTDSGDLKAVSAFYATPPGTKFAALNPRKIEIDRKWSNYISPEAASRVERVILESMIAHIAQTDPEVAEAMRKELKAELGS